VSGSTAGWQPTTIRRFVRALPTSARTVLVETDLGKGYLKAIGGPEGPHTLACEWVGTQLAKWFGLATLDFALVHLTEEDDLPFADGGHAERGPAFITRAESGEPWGGDPRQLKGLANPEDISRLVVFDTWTLNCDRHSEPPEGRVGRNRVNQANVFLSEEAPARQLLLKAIDHTHCFTCGRPLTRALRFVDRIKDRRVFGLFPEFREFLSQDRVALAVRRLRQIDRATVGRMTQTIPREWDVNTDVQEALVDLILSRAEFVADSIEARLWPQRELPF